MTGEKDIVLIYFEDQPLLFARIEDISPDHKKDWYHVKLLFLKMPVQVVTWILRSAYIDGEQFTMNGNRMRMEKVVCPQSDAPFDESEDSNPENGKSENDGKEESQVSAGGAKVISFLDRKD